MKEKRKKGKERKGKEIKKAANLTGSHTATASRAALLLDFFDILVV
jgi:hypothetical protein